LLLVATYNPTEWNYVRWSMANYETSLSLTVLFGLILLVGYIIYLRATLRSIGVFGMILILAVVGTILWVLYDQEIISLDNPSVNTWIGIVALSIVLAVGLSWSIVRRRLSGQADVDDIDE
jgi:Na+/glutamate symporter